MALYLIDKTANAIELTNSSVVETSTTPFAASTVAADFEAGSSSYLTVADNAPLSITGDLTIECWLNLESVLGDGESVGLAVKYGSAGNRSYAFYIYRTGTQYIIRHAYSDDGTNVTVHGANISTPSAGTYYHYAMSFDASAHATEFMVDGSSVGTDTGGTRTAIYNGTAAFDVGRTNASIATNYVDGKLDELRVWNVTKSATDINTSKAVELTGSESGLVAYWQFELAGSAFTPKVIFFN